MNNTTKKHYSHLLLTLGWAKRPLPKHNLLRKQCPGCLGTCGVTDPVYGFSHPMKSLIVYVSVNQELCYSWLIMKSLPILGPLGPIFDGFQGCQQPWKKGGSDNLKSLLARGILHSIYYWPQHYVCTKPFWDGPYISDFWYLLGQTIKNFHLHWICHTNFWLRIHVHVKMFLVDEAILLD